MSGQVILNNLKPPELHSTNQSKMCIKYMKQKPAIKKVPTRIERK